MREVKIHHLVRGKAIHLWLHNIFSAIAKFDGIIIFVIFYDLKYNYMCVYNIIQLLVHGYAII